MGASYGHDVLVLGAGFSRALSDSMPLTDELGNLCLRDEQLRRNDRVPSDGFSRGSFETWLSGLADEQPYLSAQENLENQALFLRFSGAIADVLGERVNEALDADWPTWFPEFLRVAHRRRATLITFNYDPLIECGVDTGLLDDSGTPEPVFWAEVHGDIPSWPPGTARFGANPAQTFRLLKLHGSLNWYWSPDDTSGASVARRDLPGAYGRPEPYTEADRRRELPGRVPFVVPPAATKSPYYRNPIVREIWRQAAESLRSAARVTVLGYSMPPSDLTVAGMFKDTLLNTDASIRVIDIDPTSVTGRLTSLGFPQDRLQGPMLGSEQPVADFVAAWRDETGAGLVRELEAGTDESLDSPLLVYWGRDVIAPVTAVEASPDRTAVELVVDAPGSLHQATRARLNENRFELPVLRSVLSRVADRRLTVRGPAGNHTLIGATTTKANVGHGAGIWNVLTPSGPYEAPSRGL